MNIIERREVFLHFDVRPIKSESLGKCIEPLCTPRPSIDVRSDLLIPARRRKSLMQRTVGARFNSTCEAPGCSAPQLRCWVLECMGWCSPSRNFCSKRGYFRRVNITSATLRYYPLYFYLIETFLLLKSFDASRSCQHGSRNFFSSLLRMYHWYSSGSIAAPLGLSKTNDVSSLGFSRNVSSLGFS